MKSRLILGCTACLLVSCQTLKPGPYTQVRGTPQPTSVPVPLDAAGEFDNHEQVAVASATSNNASVATPHIVVKITATKDSEWTLWQIRLDGTASLQATWAMQRRAGTWVPYRAEAAVVSSPMFDSKQWTAIEGCILHGDGSGRSATANAELCASFTAMLGAAAALLPLTVKRDGDTLHVRLFADQARGPAAGESAREVVYFGGWAAINGAGPNAVADSKDWHVRNDVRIGNEGGRFALTWRDGKPSGYSLLLERMTYRNGKVPVLKLVLTEDASDRTLAYAWANPEATQIGLNIGWVQVGLERAGIAPSDFRRYPMSDIATIAWADFERVLAVAGTIVRVEAFPEARKPAYKVWVDFGPYGERKTSAQIAALYRPEDLVGKQIVGVINFAEKQIGPFRSQFLLTGFNTDAGVVITTIERPVPNGSRLA